VQRRGIVRHVGLSGQHPRIPVSQVLHFISKMSFTLRTTTPVVARAAAPRAQAKPAQLAPAPKAAASLKPSAVLGFKASRKVSVQAAKAVTVQAALDWPATAAAQENFSPLEVMDHVRPSPGAGTPDRYPSIRRQRARIGAIGVSLRVSVYASVWRPPRRWASVIPLTSSLGSYAIPPHVRQDTTHRLHSQLSRLGTT
jgi:hypothetical protein